MKDKLAQLKHHLAEAYDLEAAARLLKWDQNTYMPPGGAAARGRQIALLQRLAHEKLTNPTVGRLLDELQPYAEELPYDSDEASLVRAARRRYERETRVPSDFVAQLHAHTAATYQVWTEARPADDFAMVQPYLERTLDLCQQYATFFPEAEHPADPLIDKQEEGMTAASVSAVFSKLREQLVPLVKAVTEQPPADDTCLRRLYPEPQQLAFGLEIAERFGYDLQRGRLDKSPHPFTTRFSIDDVRITTRVDEHHLNASLFSILHEAGHAMYEQGVNKTFEGTPLARGTSSGMHESQSRLWENLVGRSRTFWSCFYPRLQATFPGQLDDVDLETFYRAINRVEPSLIRVEADEVTYNLHVLMRFDFELQMLEGSLAVRDLPEAWRERMRADLGIVPPDDRDGALQDIHWYFDVIGGMFQCYTLGNLMSVQLYEAALHAHPEIMDEMAEGKFDTLHGWLTENVHRHGRKFTPDELIERATGTPLSVEPYMHYLRTKYGDRYALAADNG